MGGSESKDLKKNPNEVCVEECTQDDNSTVWLHPKKMEELNIIKGDVVKLTGTNKLQKGKKRRDTIVNCQPIEEEDELPQEKIRMNKVVRNNLRVRFGDYVKVESFADVKEGKKVYCQPIEDTITGITGSLT